MTAILGIDAAWSPKNPSGIALVAKEGGHWTCKALSPSYASFMRNEATEDCWQIFPGGEADIPRLIQAATKIAVGQPPTVIAVDMPLSTKPIHGRRVADQKASQYLGQFKCPVHSPTASRPGMLGQRFMKGLADAGYPLATATTEPGTHPSAIEVYPHAAIVRLMSLPERLKYKVSRSRRLWPCADVRQRIIHLITAFRKLKHALDTTIRDIALPLPEPEDVQSLSSLKPYEDALDALVCAWAGIRYVEGRAQAFGDREAAIWVPTA